MDDWSSPHCCLVSVVFCSREFNLASITIIFLIYIYIYIFVTLVILRFTVLSTCVKLVTRNTYDEHSVLV
jgi:hypothetical protein